MILGEIKDLLQYIDILTNKLRVVKMNFQTKTYFNYKQ